jgi:predicted RNA-binding Zn-ribbon protein involved in translation (DUF1610 family)
MNSQKFLLVSFHCDKCGHDTHIAGTDVHKEKDGSYHCLHCGNNGKSFYPYDDYFVKKV